MRNSWAGEWLGLTGTYLGKLPVIGRQAGEKSRSQAWEPCTRTEYPRSPLDDEDTGAVKRGAGRAVSKLGF